jgi:hypothetical protein
MKTEVKECLTDLYFLIERQARRQKRTFEEVRAEYLATTLRLDVALCVYEGADIDEAQRLLAEGVKPE